MAWRRLHELLRGRYDVVLLAERGPNLPRAVFQRAAHTHVRHVLRQYSACGEGLFEHFLGVVSAFYVLEGLVQHL